VGIFLEFIPSLFIALAFDFILYITGACVLRVISFGVLKYHLHNYTKYKELKAKSNNSYFIPYLIGVLFYALVIVVIAWLN
jgi:hypothetical protein